MSDEKQTSNTESAPLFENKFVVVTSEGEIILKETSHFEQRTLTSVDPDSVEAQIEDFENTFENLRGRADKFLEELKENVDFDTDEATKMLEDLKKEILSTDAVGDFEALIDEASERFEAVLTSVTDDSGNQENEKTEEIIGGQESKKTDPDPDNKTEVEVADKSAADTSELAKEESKAKKADKTKKEADEKKSDVSPDVEMESEDLEETEDAVNSTDPKEAETEEKTKETDDDELSEEVKYYKSLADKAEQLVDVSDWAYVSMEFDNIDNTWAEGPDTEEADIKTYREQIDQLRKEFEEKKQSHYEEQKRRRQENLEKKNAILESMQKIVDEEQWTATKEVGKLKGKWERIKAVPSESAEDLEKKFNDLLRTFDDHKVDRLVKKKQKEADNLTGKLVILEKMESFLEKLDETSNWAEMEESFEQLAKQFRKIGRVPVEKNQEVWNTYHQLQDTFHSMRFKHDKEYRNTIEKYLSRKKKLIDEAEALIDANDLADAARKVNKLHRRWKKAGNLPQKDENELWDRFKAATDAFNDKKSENIDVLRDQEQKNLEEKHALIEKAEALKDSDDWEQTHRDLQSLMDKWKNVGPVPKRSSGKIWKKFKGAMDHFYNRRREHFKEVKDERKDNLKEKEEVLSKLRELKDHEDPIEAVNLAKPLQAEFKKAGYVPIKHKNRMWKEYREICDVIYDRFRAAKAAVDVVGRENVENFSVDDIADIRKMNSKASSLRKQISKMEQELIKKKESLSYFKPSGKSNPLLDEVKQKIEKAEEEMASKEEQLAELEKKIDQIKKEGE
ncbi:hypothetical protein BH23BAC3_BH23BAC3_34170 [soil metagenome]